MLLRRELIARLEASGWALADSRHEDKGVLIRPLRPLTDGFAATAEVDLVPASPDRPPVAVNDVSVGVAYEPLRRLLALLGDRFGLALLGTSTRFPDDEDWEDELERDRADERGSCG